MERFSLKGKNAVLLGGGGVLGTTMSKGLAEAGANVAVCDLRLENAEEVVKEVLQFGVICKAYKLNALDLNDLKKVCNEVMADFGRIDIIVNAVGGNMKSATTSDEVSFFDLDGESLKKVVSNFTQWLAVDLAKTYGEKIRVNAMAPGFFLTKQNRFLLTSKEDGNLTQRGETILSHTPIGRFGVPDDIVGTLVWLASDASKFVTGIVVQWMEASQLSLESNKL
ncbi:MAG TPA: SDR family oxidoreductase [Clostridiaceae bacterium]